MSLGTLQFHDANLLGVLLALVPMLVNAGIFVYALRKLPRDQLTATFLIYVVCVITWQAFDMGVRLSETAETARTMASASPPGSRPSSASTADASRT